LITKVGRRELLHRMEGCFRRPFMWVCVRERRERERGGGGGIIRNMEEHFNMTAIINRAQIEIK
jgi:hypothetical protein